MKEDAFDKFYGDVESKLFDHPNFQIQDSNEIIALSLLFYPTFLQKSRMDFLVKEDFIDVEVTIDEKYFEKLKIEVQNFQSEILKLQLLEASDNLDGGRDGVVVFCLVQYKSQLNYFKYWSPDSKSIHYTLSSLVFKLLYNSNLPESISKYLEHLNDYFGFIDPFYCKDMKDYYHLKIFGTLSWQFPFETKNPLQKRFKECINRFSKEKPIILDLSNFHLMGSAYNEIFTNFFHKYKNILPVMNERAQNYFKNTKFINPHFTSMSDAIKSIASSK